MESSFLYGVKTEKEQGVTAVTNNDLSKRMKATWVIGIFIVFVGAQSRLSYGAMADVQLFNKTIIDLMDYAVSIIWMPLGRCIIDRDFCILEKFENRFVCRIKTRIECRIHIL
ncbi:hypothetical protein ACQKM9_14030 [Viridibacillus sp. NPDC093762]|uniref:hypothetical protein n=1 Tax=Viridibacillus sp. NPDC093762 TaxID=3390720 RepID=UPI003D063AEA